MLRALIEAIWRLLPDRCVVDTCCRKGVRGNENILADGIVVCDYCHAALIETAFRGEVQH